VYASRVSRCTAKRIVTAISSVKGGTLATERLQYDVPHPRRQPSQALVVPEGAVLACLGLQGRHQGRSGQPTVPAQFQQGDQWQGDNG
jgi:hypothetical protein